MAFGPNELEMYPDNRSEDQIEFIDDNEIVIDNGSDRIKVDLQEIRHNIEHLMNEEGVCRLIDKIRDFSEEVQNEKQKGVHLGSSDLANAVSSEILTMKPDELGLRTDKEVSLVVQLVKTSCKKDDMLEFE